MRTVTNDITWNPINSDRWVPSANYANRGKVLNSLKQDLKKWWWVATKHQLHQILSKNDENKLRLYTKKIRYTIYKNKELNDPEVQKWLKLFQTAFLEMEWLFGEIPRTSWWWKTWFDHVLWVLNNILAWPNPTIEECIIAILHDSIEEIKWYTAQHIKETYGEKIANSVNNLSKEPLAYYVKWKWWKNIKLNELEDENRNELTNEITRKTRREHYYGNISNREINEINVKFADRLDSLNTMYIKNKDGKMVVDKPYLIKKIGETEKYFLIPKLKAQVSDFHYTQLENKYTERKNKLDSGKI